MKLNEISEEQQFSDRFKKMVVNSYYYKENLKDAIKWDESSIFEITRYLTLYHSSKTKATYGIKDIVKRKKPKDSLHFAHHYVNEKSKEALGIDIRNLLFAGRNISPNDYGGQLYAIIPLGRYKLYYHQSIDDMTSHFNLYREYYSSNNSATDLRFVIRRRLLDQINTIPLFMDYLDSKDIEDLKVFGDITGNNDTETMGIVSYNDRSLEFVFEQFLTGVIEARDKHPELIDRKFIEDYMAIVKHTVHTVMDELLAKQYVNGITAETKTKNIEYISEIMVDAKQYAYINAELYDQFLHELKDFDK